MLTVDHFDRIRRKVVLEGQSQHRLKPLLSKFLSTGIVLTSSVCLGES